MPVQPESDYLKLSKFVYDECTPLYSDFVGSPPAADVYFSLRFFFPSVEQSAAHKAWLEQIWTSP